MKTQLIISSLLIICVLAACQSEKPLPSITVTTNNEFTLAPAQSAIITNTDLTITFNSVLSDDRCPSEVECAVSGPVAVSLLVSQGNENGMELKLQTFTDQNGRAPGREFEGIEDRADLGDYLLQITGVTPYPKNLTTRIKPSEYQVILVVVPK
jgi:hypothetical protein